MSGGSLDYFYCILQEHDKDFDDIELNDLVKDLADLFHDREWYLSADTSEGQWNESRDNFKKKWFTESGRKERIEKYLEDFSEEIRRSFGISNKYCCNCDNWYNNEIHDNEYGDCKVRKGCLWHKKEYCDKFISKGE